jgi:glucose/arabinose dehydrogenase
MHTATMEPDTAAGPSKRKRLSPFARLLIGCALVVGIAGAALHAFQFNEPVLGPLKVELVKAFPELPYIDHPLYLGHAGDGTNRLFVIAKPGVIHVFPNDPKVSATTKFLDITEQVIQWHNEEGLLGLAFDPAYKSNGHFYVHYSRAGTGRKERYGRISRFTVSQTDPNKADPSSELVLFEIKQPWGNHNGGCLAFGPDGYLYFSLGDGGAAGDRLNAGQDLNNLLGTICRIDVTGATKAQPYKIPADNPFAKRQDAKPEIWAWGLRNVWRFSFDRKTGDLWAGDVGQNKWEEIDLVTKGGNYGWRAFEGDAVYDQALASDDAAKSMIAPITTHPRDEAKSITGGYVYRGTREPKLQGLYIYGDYVSRFIWALAYDTKGKAVIAHDYVGKLDGELLSSFGEDEAGELYAVGFNGGLYRVAAR